jgi:hypothetical protein
MRDEEHDCDDKQDSEFAEITIAHKDSLLIGATVPLEAKALSATQQISITSLVDELNPHSLTEVLMTLVPQERRVGHCIILYLPGMREPIELWNQSHITIGRYDSQLKYRPTVDLSKHHAAQLGVSRIHAEITYENAGYYIQDLESRNGTWVNKTKLLPGQKLPISHRDSLRIGHFMIQVGSCQYT